MPHGATVIIDPGHGGRQNPGVCVDGFREASWTLDLATRLADIINDAGYLRAGLTRCNDSALSISDRHKSAIKAGADLIISIHANASADETDTGLLTLFLSSPSRGSEITAQQIAAAAPEPLVRRQGWYAANPEKWPRAYSLLSTLQPNLPAGPDVVLVECFFATNPGDREYAVSSLGTAEIAVGIARGLYRAEAML